MAKILIAVYGSLRRGMSANSMMEKDGINFVGEDTINATLYDLGWYPGIKLGDVDTPVVVDIYEVDTETPALRALNRYEGYEPLNRENSLFVLSETVRNSDGKKVMCYEYNRSIANRAVVEGGDWARYVSERNSRNAA